MARANQIPRISGAFSKRQIENVQRAGADVLCTAMFDELDECAAIMKVTPDHIPACAVALDADCPIANDHYLRIAGQAAKILCKSVPPGNVLSKQGVRGEWRFNC